MGQIVFCGDDFIGSAIVKLRALENKANVTGMRATECNARLTIGKLLAKKPVGWIEISVMREAGIDVELDDEMADMLNGGY